MDVTKIPFYEFIGLNRALLSIEVSLFDEEGIFVMQSVFEWFLTKQ